MGNIFAQNPFLDGHDPTYGTGTGGDSDRFEISDGNRINMTSVDSGKDSYAVNVTASGGTVFEDGNNWRILTVTVVDAVNPPTGKRLSSPPPAVDLNTLAHQGVAIPQHIADRIASRSASDPIAPVALDGTFAFPLATDGQGYLPDRPVAPDGTFDFPLVIDGNGYLLDGFLNTLVPHVVESGQKIEITFTAYSRNDIAHFALYLNLQGNDVDYSNSDTHITYRNDGTVRVSDPHGYISNATMTVSQDWEEQEKKTITVTIQFDEPMGLTNMVAYLWDTNSRSTLIRMLDTLDVVPKPVPVDQEPNIVDPEPTAAPGIVDHDPMEDQNSAERVLLAIRMWSGFESESITDAQLLASLGLDYPGMGIPNWVMVELGVLVAKGDVTVDEFKTALEYVLERS